MCGIAGIIQAGSSGYSLQSISLMTDALAHRGPDGEDAWQSEDGSVLLGHRRLSIIGLDETGQQPMPYADRYHIIHNGEIYNYRELRDELRKHNYHFRSQTDTEVIVAAFDHWGEDCVDHFDGMFSFAIWDEKEKELFAARDRFGEKPFFYFFDGDRLLFASEMKALWAAGIPRVANQKMLFNFITIGYTDNPAQPGETFFEQVHKLPAASILKYNCSDRRLVLEKYWDIDPEKQNRKITDNEAKEHFASLFAVSVNRRLRSDVAIGTSLSGGLDSSSIIAKAANSAGDQIIKEAFTASFPGFEKDELPYSKEVAAAFDLHQSVIEITADGMLADWDKLCWQQEEPFGSASIYAQYKVYELAGQHNIKVLLDGQGADEVLAGYHKYYKWFWQELFRRRKLYGSKELTAAKEIGINESFGPKNMIAAYFPLFSTIVMEKQYLLHAIGQEDLSRDFVKLQSKEAYYTTPEHFTLNGALYFNTCTHGLEELLRYSDRNAMAHGREVRLPFLSHELVEFIFSLPAHFKIRQGWTKWLLRDHISPQLPASITWRKDKVGFEPPQKKWMDMPQVQDAIREAKKKLVAAGVLKPGVVDKKILSMSSHAPDNYDWRYFSAAALFK